MKGDKFEQKLMTRLSKGTRIDTTSCVLTEILSDYRAFKSEKPQPTEDEFDIAIETEQNKVINPGMLDMAVSDNDNYKLGFIHGLQKSKYVYRSLATKPTAPASLVEVDHSSEDPKELDNLRDIRDINNYIIRECAYIAPKFKGVVMKEIDDLPHYTPRYRPAPSDEGLREGIVKICVESRREGESEWIPDRVADFVLSRHPSTDKTTDHFVEVNKLVKRLREHISDQKLKEADYLVYDEIEAIINEFEKDADGGGVK